MAENVYVDCEHIAAHIGTSRWVVSPRWTQRLRARYDVRLSQSEFDALKTKISRSLSHKFRVIDTAKNRVVFSAPVLKDAERERDKLNAVWGSAYRFSVQP